MDDGTQKLDIGQQLETVRIERDVARRERDKALQEKEEGIASMELQLASWQKAVGTISSTLGLERHASVRVVLQQLVRNQADAKDMEKRLDDYEQLGDLRERLGGMLQTAGEMAAAVLNDSSPLIVADLASMVAVASARIAGEYVERAKPQTTKGDDEIPF